MENVTTEILFKKFEVIETLKKDTNTSVYLANHTYLNKRIILKTLNTRDLSDKTILARFKREAKILAKLDHPNLIEVLDFGTYEDHFYLSFEYFQSRNLREIIKGNKLSLNNKIHLLVQLLRALSVAHGNQIIHRDIKPENILVNSSLDLKIADFGLALILNETNLTHQSSIVGTPSYMSTEQIRGEILTTQSDIFSAGIVTYELFTGTNPFIGKDIGETINKILNFDEELISNGIKDLPKEIQHAIKSMLRKSFRNRVKSAEDVLNYLGIPLEEPENQPTTGGFAEKRKKYLALKKRKTFALVLIPILIVASAAFYFLFIKGWGIEQTNLGIKSSEDFFIKEQNKYLVADQKKNETNINDELSNNVSLIYGKLFVECTPWGDVYIDNKKTDTTPLKDYIQLSPGKHTLKVIHPDYPPFTKKISISSEKIESISIDFKNLVGYLICNINPWGDVYVDGVLKGTTPLRGPIILFPGKHLLTIKNPQFESVETNIKISIRDTVNYKLNF